MVTIEKKCLTSFAGNDIQLKNFNSFATLFHKLGEKGGEKGFKGHKGGEFYKQV